MIRPRQIFDYSHFLIQLHMFDLHHAFLSNQEQLKNIQLKCLIMLSLVDNLELVSKLNIDRK